MHSDLTLEMDVVIQLISDSEQLSDSSRVWILQVLMKLKEESEYYGRDAVHDAVRIGS